MQKRDGSLRRDGSARRDGGMGQGNNGGIKTGLLAPKGSFLICKKCHKAVLRTTVDIHGTDPIREDQFIHIDGTPVDGKEPIGCKFCGAKSDSPYPLQFFQVAPPRSGRRG